MSDNIISLSAAQQQKIELTLEQFLIQVERRAYRTAMLTTRRTADALDIVQDAMLQLTQHYSARTADEWPRLFHRILQHRITDWHRQQMRIKKWFWQVQATDDNEIDNWADPVDESEQDPPELLERARDIQAVLHALEDLPFRQRQAFILRAWEEYSVEATAEIMVCSEGSVKTHYFRAVQNLRKMLLAEE